MIGSEEVIVTIICPKGKIDHANKANMSTQQQCQATAQPVSQNVVRNRLLKLSLPKFRGDVTKLEHLLGLISVSSTS